MKGLLFIIGVLILSAALVLTACGGAVTPTPTPTPTPTATKLKLAQYLSPDYAQAKQVVEWMDLVKERSQGQVQFEYFPAGQLLGGEDMWDAIREGRIDIGFTYNGYIAGKDPLFGFSDSALFIFNDHEHAWRVIDAVFRDIADEAWRKNNGHLLEMPLWDYDVIATVNTPVRVPSDIKGLKIRTFCKAYSNLLSMAGASPLFMSSSEVYMAIERGLLDGLTTSPATIVARKIYEVLPDGYLMEATWSMGTSSLAINLDVWNKLPKDIQDIMDSAGREVDEKYVPIIKRQRGESLQIISDAGVEILELTLAQAGIWRELARPVYEGWMETCPDGARLAEVVEEER